MNRDELPDQVVLTVGITTNDYRRVVPMRVVPRCVRCGGAPFGETRDGVAPVELAYYRGRKTLLCARCFDDVVRRRAERLRQRDAERDPTGTRGWHAALLQEAARARKKARSFARPWNKGSMPADMERLSAVLRWREAMAMCASLRSRRAEIWLDGRSPGVMDTPDYP